MFFKTGALKVSAIFSIKNRLQYRCFPVRPLNIAKFLKEQLFDRTPQVAASLFF